MKALYVFLAFLFIFLTSCKKDVLHLDTALFQVAPNQHTLAILPLSKDTLLAGIGKIFFENGYIYKSVDAGQSWNIDFQLSQAPVSFYKKGNFVQAIAFGNEFYYKPLQDDYWTNIFLLGWEYWSDIAVNNQNRVLAVGGLNFAFGYIQPIDRDANIANLPRQEFEHELKAVDFANDSVAIAVGYGTILRSTNAGNTWQYLEHRGDFFHDVQFVNDSCAFIIGLNGSILHSNDIGQTWKQLAKPSTFSNKKRYKKLFFASETLGWIAGEKGKLWQTTNAGKDWILIDSKTDLDFNDIAYAAPYLFVATEEGYVLRVTL